MIESATCSCFFLHMALMQSLFTLQQPIYTTESDMRHNIVTPVVMKDDSTFVEIPIVMYGLSKNFP